MSDPPNPATPFWQGYERSTEVTALLVSAIRAALYARPEERLGQLLTNVLGDDLFSVWDEVAARKLVEAAHPASSRSVTSRRGGG